MGEPEPGAPMAIDPKRVKEIFLDAAELPDEPARAAYLDRACGGDAGLRERVEALLRSHDPAGSFLGTPGGRVPGPGPARATIGVRTVPECYAATRTGDGNAPTTRCRSGSWPRPPGPTRSAGSGTTRCSRCSARAGFGIVFRAFDDMLAARGRGQGAGPAAGRHVAGPQAVPARGPLLAPRSGTRTSCRSTRSRSSRCRTW